MQEIPFLDRRIIRSMFHSLRNYAVNLGYFPNVGAFTSLKDPNQVAEYRAELEKIRKEKGFYIDFFSESSARNKGEKFAPRIVLALDRVYNGEIGAPAQHIIGGNRDDGYTAASFPGLTGNLVIGVYLISHNSEQTYVLNGIKDNVLGQRNYIYLYDDPNRDEHPFYLYQSSFYSLDDPVENVNEKAYIYTVPDVFLGENTNVRRVAPISEIHVDFTDPGDNFIVKL